MAPLIIRRKRITCIKRTRLQEKKYMAQNVLEKISEGD